MKPARHPAMACFFVIVFIASSAELACFGQPFEILTRPHSHSRTAAGASMNPQFSASGGHILCASYANNLVTNDHLQPYLDLFVYDTATRTTELISLNQYGGGGGDGDCGFASISSNGVLVVFASAAGNLVDGDTNKAWDIFRHDRERGETRLLTRDWNGLESARGGATFRGLRLSSRPLISADGTRVVFESLATNLVSLPDDNEGSDIYYWNAVSDRTELVSINHEGTTSGDGSSFGASLSSDGSRVAFVSEARNLTLLPALDDRLREIFVRDLSSGQLFWISQDVPCGTNGYHWVGDPLLSPDGSRVAFKAWTEEDDGADGFVYDIDSAALHSVPTLGLHREGDWQFSEDATWLVYEDEQLAFRWRVMADDDPEPLTVPLAACSDGWSRPVRTWAPSLNFDGTCIAYLATKCPDEVWLVVTNLTAMTLEMQPMLINGPGPITMDREGTKIAFDSLSDSLVADDLNGESDVFLWHPGSNPFQVVSAPDTTRPAGSGTARTFLDQGAISANGRTVVFTTMDNNLVTQDENHWRSLVAYDFGQGKNLPLDVLDIGSKPTLTTISNASSLGFQTNAPPRRPQVTADGRHVILEQRDTYSRIDPDWFNSAQIVRRDLDLDTAHFHGAKWFEELYGSALHPAISHDGVFIAWEDVARSQIHLNPIGPNDFFVAFETHLLSRKFDSSGEANGSSTRPILSPDKRWLVYFSTATDLTPSLLIPRQRLYAQDFRLGRSARGGNSKLISIDEFGEELPESLAEPVFSLDARWVMMTDTNAHAIYLYPLYETGPSRLICRDCGQGSMSRDARWVAYTTRPASDAYRQVVLQDVSTREEEVISRTRLGEQEGAGDSHSPVVTFDGRYVYFLSRAEELVENDGNRYQDLFVYNVQARTNGLLTRSLVGNYSANGPTLDFLLSADGRRLIVESWANDLAPHDYNLTSDIFSLVRAGVDADADGLEDDWEWHYFGNLDHDGLADTDGDGQIDIAEFQAGTDPSSDRSQLMFKEIHHTRDKEKPFFHPYWNGLYIQTSPGRTYRVQFKRNLLQPNWIDFPDTFTAGGLGASVADISADVDFAIDPLRRTAYFRLLLVE